MTPFFDQLYESTYMNSGLFKALSIHKSTHHKFFIF
jgi:hypothetical protein